MEIDFFIDLNEVATLQVFFLDKMFLVVFYMRVKVAVFGSCVTRDIFNSKFNYDYKNYFECILTQNQTSVISLMSKPIKVEESKINNLNEYDKWNIKTEFTKEFISLLIEKRPDYLILDFFADIHFGVLKIGNDNYITNNRWKLWKTDFYKEMSIKNELTFETHIDEYIQLWVASIDKFFIFLSRELPNLRVIINNSKFTDYYICSETKLIEKLSTSGKCKLVDVEQSNFIWEHLNNHILENYDVEILNLTKNDYYSFEDHPWGPFYVHYTMDFYNDALKELIKITHIFS